MVDFRTPAAAILLVGLTLSVAAAESSTVEDLSSDTATQHHLWSQKFDTILEPETTGSDCVSDHFWHGYDSPRMRPGRAGVQQPSFPGLAYRVLFISSEANHGRWRSSTL